MKEIVLSDTLQKRLIRLYQEMETEYDRVASLLNFSCTGCPDNCCDSYFEHHTYVEWAYLRQGFSKLSTEKQQKILQRAKSYLKECNESLSRGQRPQVMCPLNEEGLCTLYPYRLLVCRTHGVPASMTRPDGKKLVFPGCFRCQELVALDHSNKKAAPCMERTPLFRQMALLENDLFAGKRHLYSKIKLTIAQMLVEGPPSIPVPHCER